MDKFTVRRKILRGSLSAPVVLTVASPASLAAASTTCLINTDQSKPPPLFQEAADGYLRKQIQVCQAEQNGPYLYQDKIGAWREVDTGNAVPVTGTPALNCQSKEVLVYVNAQGQETWYGWPSTTAGGSFTSIGCWNSLLITP